MYVRACACAVGCTLSVLADARLRVLADVRLCVRLPLRLNLAQDADALDADLDQIVLEGIEAERRFLAGERA